VRYTYIYADGYILNFDFATQPTTKHSESVSTCANLWHMSMAKPSNIFYVLRICETTTLRHLAYSLPVNSLSFPHRQAAINPSHTHIYGWEYIKNTLTKISSPGQRDKKGGGSEKGRLRKRNHVTGLQGHTLWGNQNRSKCHL